MKSVTTLLLAMLFVVVQPGSAQAKEYQEGKEYVAASTQQPTSTGDKIEVVELFWYGCPHCYDLEPEVQAWLERKPDYVELVRMPAIVESALGTAGTGLLHGRAAGHQRQNASCPV